MKKNTSARQLTICSVILIFVNILLVAVGLFAVTLNPVFGIVICILGFFGLSTGIRYNRISKEIKRHLHCADCDQTETASALHEETFHAGGVSYQHDEIKELGVYNPQYDMSKKELEETTEEYVKIFKRLFHPQDVTLQPDPDNTFYPDSIKILIDGVHVGYIKSGQCAHVKELIDNNKITSITAKITGGKYKRLVPAGNGTLTLDYDKDEFTILLTITTK